ncbi:MAG: sigma-70 family RNA polymerase sigma factor [Alphaproteobacteria bacterium]|nr:sigma-70 family RNA polymerase sigma factor [Alphaproteobacteria bacterium]
MAIKTEDDPEFLSRLAAGDREAFAWLFRQYNAGMIRLATTILKNRASAEEVAQEAWLSVLTHIGQFESRSSLAGWVFTILVNAARRRAAQDGRAILFDPVDDRDPLADSFDAQGKWQHPPERWESLTAEHIVSDRQLLAQVEQAISQLPPAQRSVLILRTQSGMEAADICRILGISDSNMRVLLHRARQTLKQMLGEFPG